MFVIGLLAILAAVVVVYAITWAADTWTTFRRVHLHDWLKKVQSGLCHNEARKYNELPNAADPVVCPVQSTPLLRFLAKHTKCRIVKYNGDFFTEIRTWGTEWVELSKRSYGTWTKSNRYDTLQLAEEAITQTIADVQCWMANSVSEDPNRYKRIVVSQQNVTEKESK